MTDVNQSEILRLTMNYRAANNDIHQNVTHFQYLDPATITEADVISDLTPWVYGFGLGWQNMGSNNMELEDYDLAVFKPGLNFVNLGKGIISITGNAISQGGPPGAGALITRSVVGSRGTAKKFLPGLTEGQQDAGVIDPATIALMAIVAAAWIVTPDSYVGVTRNYNQVTHQGVYNVGLDISPIATLSPVVAYQRRRKQGVGI